jgi:hypothetical protein
MIVLDHVPGAGRLHAVAGNVLIMEQDRILREALTVSGPAPGAVSRSR